jgi:hypothetical protein
MGVVPAGQAAKLRLAGAVACRNVPALGAPLRGVTGVDCDRCPPGAFSLGGNASTVVIWASRQVPQATGRGA